MKNQQFYNRRKNIWLIICVAFMVIFAAVFTPLVLKPNHQITPIENKVILILGGCFVVSYIISTRYGALEGVLLRKAYKEQEDREFREICDMMKDGQIEEGTKRLEEWRKKYTDTSQNNLRGPSTIYQ